MDGRGLTSFTERANTSANSHNRLHTLSDSSGVMLPMWTAFRIASILGGWNGPFSVSLVKMLLSGIGGGGGTLPGVCVGAGERGCVVVSWWTLTCSLLGGGVGGVGGWTWAGDEMALGRNGSGRVW